MGAPIALVYPKLRFRLALARILWHSQTNLALQFATILWAHRLMVSLNLCTDDYNPFLCFINSSPPCTSLGISYTTFQITPLGMDLPTKLHPTPQSSHFLSTSALAHQTHSQEWMLAEKPLNFNECHETIGITYYTKRLCLRLYDSYIHSDESTAHLYLICPLYKTIKIHVKIHKCFYNGILLAVISTTIIMNYLRLDKDFF